MWVWWKGGKYRIYSICGQYPGSRDTSNFCVDYDNRPISLCPCCACMLQRRVITKSQWNVAVFTGPAHLDVQKKWSGKYLKINTWLVAMALTVWTFYLPSSCCLRMTSLAESRRYGVSWYHRLYFCMPITQEHIMCTWKLLSRYTQMSPLNSWHRLVTLYLVEFFIVRITPTTLWAKWSLLAVWSHLQIFYREPNYGLKLYTSTCETKYRNPRAHAPSVNNHVHSLLCVQLSESWLYWVATVVNIIIRIQCLEN